MRHPVLWLTDECSGNTVAQYCWMSASNQALKINFVKSIGNLFLWGTLYYGSQASAVGKQWQSIVSCAPQIIKSSIENKFCEVSWKFVFMRHPVLWLIDECSEENSGIVLLDERLKSSIKN